MRMPAVTNSTPISRAQGAVLALAAVVALVVAAGYPASSADGGARTVNSRAALAARLDVSANWAGYVATGIGSTPSTASPSMAYTDVTGQWVQPTAHCILGTRSAVAIWVGLGGYSTSSNKLEQVGTSADCSPTGEARYSVWYELLPADSVGVNLKISPGDVIASSVVANGDDVLVQVTNRTRHTRFTKHLTLRSPDRSSAEWIAEAPSECNASGFCFQVPLTNFGTVAFTRTFAKGNALPGTISSPSWTATLLQLAPHSHRAYGDIDDPHTGSNAAGAVPSGLVADGSGFSIDWQPSLNISLG
jgi:hypothetical protein